MNLASNATAVATDPGTECLHRDPSTSRRVFPAQCEQSMRFSLTSFGLFTGREMYFTGHTLYFTGWGLDFTGWEIVFTNGHLILHMSFDPFCMFGK